MWIPMVIGLSVASFIGLMLVALLMPLAPNVVIALLTRCQIYPPGELRSTKNTQIGDLGGRHQVNSYIRVTPGGAMRGENGRVFGWMTLLCVGVLTTITGAVIALLF